MINNKFLQVFGPGILFAGAAIGTSHLVQSTRAGANFGLSLFLVIVFANFIKYPFYRFGPLYTAATGNSILQGYRSIGRWALLVLIITELPVNIIIVAATSLVTSSIALSVFSLKIDVVYLASILVLLAFALISFGGYKFIDRSTKLFVATLTVCTILATVLTIPSVDWSLSNFAPPTIDVKTLAFLLALIGFMPAGASLAIMHSIWTLEKAKMTGYLATKSEAMLDLNIGYIGSAVLAICFLIMGAGTLYENQVELSANPGVFAGQVISLYSNTLGAWAGIVVGISVFAVMISTLLTTLDGFSRLHNEALNQFASSGEKSASDSKTKNFQLPIMALIGVSAISVLLLFMTNFKTFIDFVTITAFIVGPVIAILNHVVIHGKNVPENSRPSLIMSIWSIVGVLFLLILSGVYLLN